jgi:hypothetical protein
MFKETIATVTDTTQNTPLFEVAAEGMVIANQNQSGLLNLMGVTVLLRLIDIVSSG